jgi:hypothetical protein
MGSRAYYIKKTFSIVKIVGNQGEMSWTTNSNGEKINRMLEKPLRRYSHG